MDDVKRSLVTGSTGLVGGWLARTLLERGHQVRVLVRDPARLPSALSGRVEAVVGDVTDPASLAAAMTGCDWVFHAAGVPEQAVRDEGVFERVNHQGSVNVFAAARAAGVRRVVYTSTMDVFAAPPGAVLREGPVDPQPRPTAYERSKQAAELAARAAAAQGLEVVCVNPAAIYGPSSAPTMLTATIAQLVQGKVPLLPPGGMSVVYVEGLAQAHVAAAERGVAGQSYLVADAHLAPRELAQLVASQVVGVRVPATGPAWLMRVIAAVTTPVLLRLGKAPLLDPGQLVWLLNDTRVDASRAKAELGFVPTPVVEGVRRTLASLGR
jgi:nucleoside-diphosphate-sugar epimerase